MPRVPTYDNFQAAPNTLPQTRMTLPEMPDVAGQQAQQMGQGLRSLGGEVGRIALDMAQQANQVRIDDGVTQYVKASTDLEIEALQIKGRNALERPDGKSLPDEYGEKAKNLAENIEAGLGNQVQREAFRQRVGQLQGQFHRKLALHMVNAQKDYAREQRQATLDTAVYRGGVLWGDADAVQQSTDAIRVTVDQQLKDDGLDSDPKIREARMVEAMTPLHAAVLHGMVDGNRIDLARDYYAKNSATMSLQARANAMKVMEAGDFEKRTQDQADTLYSKHKGNISAALTDARTNLSGKEEDAVVTRLKNYDAERVALRERGQKDAADQAWRIYAQSGGMGKIPPSVLAAMDGRDLEALRRTARAESEAREVKTDPNIYYALTLAATQDPSFKNEDLRRYFDRLSPTDRKHFIDLQAKTAKPEDIDQVATAQQQVNAVIKSLHFEDEQAGIFTMQANKALFAAQQEKGRALNQEERQKVLDRLVLQGETRGVLWNSSARAFEADAAGKPFVPKFSDADMRKATAALQRAGIAKPTEAQIEATLKAVYGVK